MLRNTFTAALQAMFQGRNGWNNSQVNSIDASISNGYSLPWRGSGDDQDLLALAYDTSNQLRVGDAYQAPLRQTTSFNLLANGSQATEAFFVAPFAMTITGISEIHSTAGTSGSAVTMAITHDTGTQAPGAGVSVMTGTFNLKGTANTVQNATLAAKFQKQTALQTPAQGGAGIIVMQAGDRLSAKYTGTLTTLAGVVVTVALAPGGKYPDAKYVLNAAAGQVTTSIFTALRPMTVASVTFVCSAPETATGTYVLDVTKDVSTNAPGAGTSVLSATFNLKTAVANTPQTGALTATAATLLMAPGDRIAVSFTGSASPAALAGVVVVVTFAPVMDQVQKVFSLSATPGTSQAFWIADRDYFVEDIACVWGVASTSVLVLPEIDTGTTAPGSGTPIITDNTNTGFDTSTTANTVTYGTLVARHLRYMKAGDRLAFKASGTAGSFAGLQFTTLLTAV